MKSSFLEFREKIEGGCQNTCKKQKRKLKINQRKDKIKQRKGEIKQKIRLKVNKSKGQIKTNQSESNIGIIISG